MIVLGSRPKEDRPAPPRLLISLETVWGTWLLGATPGLSSEGVSRRPVKALVRLLGARQLAQAALIAERPNTSRIFASSAVDALHAASMVMLARSRSQWSRPALTSAAVAALLSSYGLHCGLRRR